MRTPFLLSLLTSAALVFGGCDTDDTAGADDTVTDDTVTPDDTVITDTVVVGDTDDSSAPGDTSAPTTRTPLLLGQFAMGVVGSEDQPAFSLMLSAGDSVRISVFELRGALVPAAYLFDDRDLEGESEFVAPETFEVTDDDVVLDYVITADGPYHVDVQQRDDASTESGTFLLRTECVAGPCLDAPAPPSPSLRLLAINDFHGQLLPPSDNAGGAAWLAAHVARLRENQAHTLFVSAGDLVGASPFVSAFFHDEPTFAVMNMMGLDVTSVGNHEFDEGPEELLRLANGGCHPEDGCRFGDSYGGADFDILAANVETDAGVPLFPSVAVRVYGGVPVAVIGMTLQGTPSVTVSAAVEGLRFEDEVRTVNALVPGIQRMGIETILVVVHEGGNQGGDANACDGFQGAISPIAFSVDNAVDILLSGHTHDTYNCVIDNKIVMSAGSAGRWISRVDLGLDATTREPFVTTTLNERVNHDIAADPAVAALVAEYVAVVTEAESEVVGTLAGALNRSTDDTGESTIGLVIADSHLFVTAVTADAQLALMNNGGIRATLPAGEITFGQVFAVQPFENDLVTVTISGSELLTLLGSQFAFGGVSVLQPSDSLRYRIEPVSAGSNRVRVVAGSVFVAGLPLDPDAPYRVTANAFVADDDPVLGLGSDRVHGIIDSDAFVDYLAASESPLPVPERDRISRD